MNKKKTKNSRGNEGVIYTIEDYERIEREGEELIREMKIWL